MKKYNLGLQAVETDALSAHFVTYVNADGFDALRILIDRVQLNAFCDYMHGKRFDQMNATEIGDILQFAVPAELQLMFPDLVPFLSPAFCTSIRNSQTGVYVDVSCTVWQVKDGVVHVSF